MPANAGRRGLKNTNIFNGVLWCNKLINSIIKNDFFEKSKEVIFYCVDNMSVTPKYGVTPKS